jgi:two-component sensor histidine kinase/PAS domain-containing protein
MPDALTRSRLEALRAYHVLDTPSEAAFDDIVSLATQICETPVGLVSLVDENRQWFKARAGFAPCETPLSQSVCSHAIQHDGVLVIPDLSKDPRTKDNILVTADPLIRFYAGAVLRSPEGEALGTLCVIDSKPRPQGLSGSQIANLEILARQVVSQMELRKLIGQRELALSAAHDAKNELAISEERYQLSSSVTGSVIWDWDRPTRVIHWGDGLTRVFGHPQALVENTRDWWLKQIHPDDRDRVTENSRAAILGTASHWTADYRFRRGDDTFANVHNRGVVVRDRSGLAVRMAGVMVDVSDRASADDRQDIINQELSHRLKNTLSMVQAIASQTLRAATSLDEARIALSNRLIALGRAHDLLLVGHAERAGMAAIIRGALSIHENHDARRLRVDGPTLEVGPRAALALALMMHELGTNAAKYGALSIPEGYVTVTWSVSSEPDATLDLVWIEQGGPPVTKPTRLGFGTRMIERALTGTPGSKVTMDYAPDGLRCVYTTPLKGFQEKD